MTQTLKKYVEDVGGSVDRKNVMKSAGHFCHGFEPGPSAWPDGRPGSLRSPFCGQAICIKPNLFLFTKYILQRNFQWDPSLRFFLRNLLKRSTITETEKPGAVLSPRHCRINFDKLFSKGHNKIIFTMIIFSPYDSPQELEGKSLLTGDEKWKLILIKKEKEEISGVRTILSGSLSIIDNSPSEVEHALTPKLPGIISAGRYHNKQARGDND
ncbi:hypothetical protein PoB_003152400 [Plakobranchus ocellatus]|uniref:Uncharacterized protein n=1 Tax=Plakobranchus ocellatus TaxID=259542 RepID=A0AAV4AF05_9GAST|nr:hypothetical protein PoB_003152400 [Plakobranchus ocellatus]